ncbi:uncharacterized protein LOC112554385 [Pomacea canaliculata]|uniref:uncharacterized protein LOC112554385 n=1 Tax=Pomacea canaliculata TaxID=400727 RepID=UPI000D72DBB4|nr:uncharacterized protein LOC112554385 [Pomacea canaliculata]
MEGSSTLRGSNKSHSKAISNILNDDLLTSPSHMSVFREDYPVHETYRPSEIARPPPLGDIMHKDEKYFCNHTSETVASFEYRPMAKPVLKDIQNKLRVTNFRMEKDPTKVNVFETTHDHYYQPKRSVQVRSGCFLGHDPKKHPISKAPSVHQSGPSTIQGDKRLGHYDTTHADQFQQKWTSVLPSFSAPTGTNIPSGDREMIAFGETTMRSSYTDSGNKSVVPFDLSGVSKQQRKTNFKLHDGHGIWDDNKSLMAVSFISKSDKTLVDRVKPSQHRNHSSIPEGDTDPERNKDHMDSTTYRYHMGNPALGLYNKIVSGANLRTKSSVWFGEPSLNRKFYETTTHHTYIPKSIPYTYKRQNFLKKSSIPLDHFNSEAYETTMALDYKKYKSSRMILNPDALDRRVTRLSILKDSMDLKTTNQEIFTPKTSEKLKYDRGRMQQSSVPMGTFSATEPVKTLGSQNSEVF